MASDADLVQRARAGSERACREIVERYQRPIFNLIVRMVRDPAVAEDLAQDTFLKLFTHLDTYDPSLTFSSWAFRIAHNATIDWLRQRRLATIPVDGPDGEGDRAIAVASGSPGPLALLERSDLRQALDSAIDRLRPEYRELVILRYQEELGYDEIAEVLSLPVGTVKSYLHRARAQLAEFIKETGWGPAEVATEPRRHP